MSEEILKALMQLFALIIKQDGGVEENEKNYVRNFLSQQLDNEKVSYYYSLFEQHAGPDELAGESAGPPSGKNEKAFEGRERDAGSPEKPAGPKPEKLTSVKDSVRILGICRKINKTLHQDQKVVVLVRLYELVNSDRKFTRQRMAIISTVADVFRIGRDESSGIEKYVTAITPDKFADPNILVVTDRVGAHGNTLHLRSEQLDGFIAFLRVTSVGLYFVRYSGSDDLYLNGLPVNPARIYLFANGSTIKLPKVKPLYYSDVASHFMLEEKLESISFRVNGLQYRFPSGDLGLRNIEFSENQGSLIGIMGASGSGKTTLLNNLCGIYTPASGSVMINGIDLHAEKEKLRGVIGLIPQDDLLIEELTVYQNLYYNAKLCFRDAGEQEIRELVNKTLANLGLSDIRDLKVGSPFNKLISGGQRKRLNIALELIREPSVLFVDEPTSGLSSRDSENVMDLLRELALKGKLVFVVIHQPSSEIYKMFDKIIILDLGGYMIYYGNPVEAIMYFKRMDAQINSEIGECQTCGNVNPELIFSIIEARVVDEFGNYTEARKVPPERWEELYRENCEPIQPPEARGKPPANLRIPRWLRQFRIYLVRDFLAKISNRQYAALTLLVAPALGLILSYIIRYIADPTSKVYIFRENENIPIYIFMSLIVALFLGLIVSAEEIFKDRKMLKRESFLDLSRSGYLLSKIVILMFISAIQAFLFVIIGNPILGIKGMTFAYWLAFFSTAVCANILGLNISAAFNSAITIYILIPMLMIPMMVLSGAMFSYDKLNRKVGSVNKVPLIAEIMIPKWSYEALMVHQFKDNRFNRLFYAIKKAESEADFKQVYLLPELHRRLEKVQEEFDAKGKIVETAGDLELLHNELAKFNVLLPEKAFREVSGLNADGIDMNLIDRTALQLRILDEYYASEFMMANTERENRILYFMEKEPGLYNLLKDDYQNESVEDYVRKVYEKNKMVEYRHELIQQIDPVYLDPFPAGWLSFRSHFFAPRKYFAGQYIDTFRFNIGFIWFLSILLYIALYYNLLYKLIHLSQKVKN
jgi:ABC-type multidrug transport system ATPase subunit